MPRLRNAFDSYARGDLAFETVLGRLERVVRRAPETAPRLLSLIAGAYEEERISARELSVLKQHVHEALFQPGAGEAQTVVNAPGAAPRRAPGPTATTPLGSGDTRNDSQLPTSDDIWLPPAQRPPGAGRLEPGDLVKERFRLLEVLGSGGMGTVYKGVDLLREEARDRQPFVALKVLNEDFRRHPDAFIALQREASRQQRLAHPNIATVYDFDRTAGGVVYIVMELLEGMALNRYVRKHVRPKGGLALAQAWSLIEPLGQALAYAHERGVVHSDFKPGNCFLTRSGGVKVLDFGMARAVANPAKGDSEKTLFDPARLGALTPAYASVEMLEGQEPDPRDDIYALACVIHELLTGHHPFGKLPASRARELGRVPAAVPGLGRRQNRALRRALAFDRASRTQGVGELLAELSGEGRRSRQWRLAAAVAALALLGVVGGLTVPQQLAEREAAAYAERLLAADETALPGAVTALAALPEAQRREVVNRVRETLTAWYERRLEALFEPAAGRFAYAEARALLEQGKSLMPDSATLQNIHDRLEARRRDWLDGVARRVDRLVASPGTLPQAGAELPVTLARVRQVDPASPLLEDPRLRAAYLAEAEAALASGRLERGAALVEGGLALAPGDAELLATSHRLRAARERLANDRAQAELLVRLDARATAHGSLEGALADLDTLARLASLAPGHPRLGEIAAGLHEPLDEAVSALIQAHDPGAAEAWLARHDRLLLTLGLTGPYRTLERAVRAFEQERETVIARLHRTLGEAGGAGLGAEQAAALAAALEPLGRRDRDVAWAREALARALLSEALRSGAEGRPAEAARALATALGLVLDEGGSTPQTSAGEADALARLREALSGWDSDRAGAGAEEPAPGLRALRAAADALEATDPMAVELAALRARVDAEAAEVVERDLARGDTAAALARVRATLALFPGLPGLTARHEALVRERIAEQAGERQRRLLRAQAQLDALLAREQPEPGTGAALGAALDTLAGQLPADSALLYAARARVAALYGRGQARLLAEGRLEQARALLAEARQLAPGAPALDTQRARLAEAEALAAEQARLAAERAELEAAQARFFAAVEANDLAAAQTLLAEIRPRLPPEDPFSAWRGPQALAALYGQLARAQAAQGALDQALELGRAALSLTPEAEPLAGEVGAWARERAAGRLTGLFEKGQTLDTPEARADVATLAADHDTYVEVRERLVALVETRVASLGEKQRGRGAALLGQARALLPDSQRLSALWERARALAEGPLAPIELAINAGQLTDAGDRLAQLLAQAYDHPLLAELRTRLGDRLKAAEGAHSQYRSALGRGDLDEAQRQLGLALQLWRDHPDYQQQRRQLDKRIADSPMP